MSKEFNVEQNLGQARLREKEYDWLTAAESYQKALDLLPEQDFLEKGEICERLSYAFHRAAMQAERQEEFRERMQRAIEVSKKAQGFYGKLTDEQKAAWVFRCEAVARYHGYWLTSVPSEKRRLLDECLELAGKALTVFESRDMLEYARTYNALPMVSWLRFHLEWDRQVAGSIVKRGAQWGEKAVAALSELGNLYETARTRLNLAICLIPQTALLIADLEGQERLRSKVIKDLSKAVTSFEEAGDTFLLGLSHFWWGVLTGGEESVKHFEKALKCGELTRDNFLTGGGLDFLAFDTYWKAIATDDPDQQRKLREKAMEFYTKAQHYYSLISFVTPRGAVIGPPAGHAENYLQLAASEVDPQKRLELLEKSEKAGMEALKLAEDSGMPRVIEFTYHVISKTLEARAHIETNHAAKRSRLERALKYREKTVEIGDQLTPFHYWNRGVMQNYLAEIKAMLAETESDLDIKKRLLEEAMLSKEKCLELCNKMIPFYEGMGDFWFFAAFRGYQDTYATLLMSLYDLTSNPEHLTKAIEVLQKAIESANKLDMISLVAESCWKIAKAQDSLGEHLEAAESFSRASENYMKASEKIVQLKGLYHDYASYMQAWSEIEKARHHHRRQEYGSAMEHFEKATDLHKSSIQWNYLAPNYSAWAHLEHAEDLSRREQTEEALQTFEKASELFDDTKRSLQTQLSKIENMDEKQMVTSMLKATDSRHRYCLARIALEEAKILDKKGDHYLSSEKYGSAVETFEKITQEIESEQDRREFRFITSLSRAWQKMTRAEAEASAPLYLEASQLFEEAKEFSPNERAKMLALGHSRFCRALEAGTKFADTRDTAMHSAAIKSLESAANYYVKAAFREASEYAKATELLFDAYVHMDNAKEEKNPEKKARLYMMAEKVLQSSAGAYMKAEHPEKSEQVQRLLEKVREERELAISLTEVLHAPNIISTTTAFTTPIPTKEEAVGLERFEHADIQANVLARQKSMKVGENLDLEIELVNTGKGSATLIKLAEVIPEGFELTEKPETYRVEDSYINMKGKRLDPLKTEEVKLVLTPRTKGTFPLKPKILYLDENGKYKAYEPEPTTIEVQELGISGWIKGPRKTG